MMSFNSRGRWRLLQARDGSYHIALAVCTLYVTLRNPFFPLSFFFLSLTIDSLELLCIIYGNEASMEEKPADTTQ